MGVKSFIAKKSTSNFHSYLKYQITLTESELRSYNVVFRDNLRAMDAEEKELMKKGIIRKEERLQVLREILATYNAMTS